jgi:hypothetical protein
MNGQAQAAQAPDEAAAVSSQAALVQRESAGGSNFPLNRIVAFLGPYIAIASGLIATWLAQHFPGLHINKTSATSAIANAIVFAIGAAVTWALHQKWLDGWQKWEAIVAGPVAGSPAPVAATPVAAPPPAPEPVATFDPAALALAMPAPTQPAANVNGATEESAGLGVPRDGF